MKSIKDFVKGAGKTIAKVGAGVAFVALPYISSGQDNPGGVPGNQIYNQFQKPDVQSRYLGKGQYEYYASGDVNNNGIPGEMADAQAIRDGVVNDMADVNVDGKVDEADAQMIENYANGTGKLIGINYMSPEFTKEERKQFIMDLYQKVYIPTFETVINSYGETIIKSIPEFTCGNYTEQAIHDFRGFSQPQKFVKTMWEASDTSKFRYKYNGRFNIQVDAGDQTTTSGGEHNVLRFPIGEDLTKPENWLSLDAQCGVDAGPGTRFMSNIIGKRYTIDWLGSGDNIDPGYNLTFGQMRGPPIANFDLTASGDSATYLNSNFKFQRPGEEPPVITSTLENTNFEYSPNLDLSPETIGFPEVTDDTDPNPVLTYSDSSTQKNSGAAQCRYDVFRRWTATDRDGEVGKLEEILKVDDTIAPEIGTYSNYIKIGENDDAIKAAKSLVNYTYDNSMLPVDTLVTPTSGNFYDIQARDVVGNLSEAISVEVDKPTGIDDINGKHKSFDLKMQNPITNSSSYMNIETENPGVTKVEVFDLNGRKVEEKVFNTSYGENVEYVDFSNLNAGMYVFRATDSNGNVDTEKIVKRPKFK